jgi:hypothetical protein
VRFNAGDVLFRLQMSTIVRLIHLFMREADGIGQEKTNSAHKNHS